MEHGAVSIRRPFDIGPDITWQDDTIDSSPSSNQNRFPHTIRPSSSTSDLTELLLKRAIIHWQTPRHIEYSTLAARLQSYAKAWPFPAAQTPEALSDAGFFYTGKITFIYIQTLTTSLEER
jgi:hypothetical protein